MAWQEFRVVEDAAKPVYLNIAMSDGARPVRVEFGRHWLAHDSIVISVASHPKPQDASRDGHANRTMMQSNPRGTESAHFLKIQRRMLGVNFKQREGLVGQGPDIRWKGAIASPEIRRRPMNHRSVALSAL